MSFGPGTLKRHVKHDGPLIGSRKTEILLGLGLFIVGCVLLWDAFDGRDKKLPWPLSGLAPW